MIHSMTKAEVEKAGALLIDTLKEGEALYPSILLRGTKEKMKKFLLQVIEEQDCYADFYYPSLKKEEKEHFLSGLSAEEKSYVQRMEWLFSSFYFIKNRAVLWGNYQMAFPLFCENEDVREYYRDLACACGLQTEMMES